MPLYQLAETRRLRAGHGAKRAKLRADTPVKHLDRTSVPENGRGIRMIDEQVWPPDLSAASYIICL